MHTTQQASYETYETQTRGVSRRQVEEEGQVAVNVCTLENSYAIVRILIRNSVGWAGAYYP